MARKQKKVMMPHAEIVTMNGVDLNPRIAGDIHRWKKEQEARERKAAQDALSSPFVTLANFRLRHAIKFTCNFDGCGRVFDRVDGLRTHRRMVHGVKEEAKC